MHNARRLHSISASELRSAFNVIESVVSYDIYNYPIDAKAFEGNTGGTRTPTYIPPEPGVNLGGWMLPDDGESSIGFYLRRHKEWRKGIMTLRIHYTSTTTTGDINLRTQIAFLSIGDANPALSFTELLVPSPATALDLIMWNPVANDEYFSMDSRYDGVVVNVGRGDTGDDSTGDVLIHLVELLYIEGVKSVGNTLRTRPVDLR